MNMIWTLRFHQFRHWNIQNEDFGENWLKQKKNDNNNCHLKYSLDNINHNTAICSID